MYNHINSHISLVIVRIFRRLTSHRTMQLHIQLHKILGNIFFKTNILKSKFIKYIIYII
jgi:hypothetical protein